MNISNIFGKSIDFVEEEVDRKMMFEQFSSVSSIQNFEELIINNEKKIKIASGNLI